VGAVTSQRVLEVLFYVNILQYFFLVENFTANAFTVAIGDNGNRLIFEIWWNFFVEDYARRLIKREVYQDPELESLSDWVRTIRSLVEGRIRKLKNCVTMFLNTFVSLLLVISVIPLSVFSGVETSAVVIRSAPSLSGLSPVTLTVTVTKTNTGDNSDDEEATSKEGDEDFVVEDFTADDNAKVIAQAVRFTKPLALKLLFCLFL
jgi:hypothetical protein